MEINKPAVLAEITKAFDRYQQAIIDNDVAILNELFWNNTLRCCHGSVPTVRSQSSAKTPAYRLICASLILCSGLMGKVDCMV